MDLSRYLPWALLLLALVVVPRRSARADDDFQVTRDPTGALASVSTNAFDTGGTNGFFANVGSNGRTCGTCHVVEDGWTFTPTHAQALASSDPLFTPNDGSDCPPTSPSQGPDRALSSEVLHYGLIRIQLGIPSTASFTLASATNPKGCAVPPDRLE